MLIGENVLKIKNLHEGRYDLPDKGIPYLKGFSLTGIDFEPSVYHIV